MNARHTHELILDHDLRERIAESTTEPDVMRTLLAPRSNAQYANCIHFMPETGHERSIPVEVRRGNGRKVPVSVSRAVYVTVYQKDLGPDDDVLHTCGAEYIDLDGKRRPCVNPLHLVPKLAN